MISFHIVVFFCSLLNGECSTVASLGPYLGNTDTQGNIPAAVCQKQGQFALAESNVLENWFTANRNKQFTYRWECDSAQVARL